MLLSTLQIQVCRDRLSVTMKKKQSGQSTVGYVIATSVLVIALFVPIGGQPSAMVQFMDAVRDLHANSTHTLSLP